VECKAKDAQISIDRIRAMMHHFQGGGKSIAPSRKLWTALHALNGYLTGQSDWMVNYAERHHRVEGCDCDHRGDGQFSGEPPNE
jgi:hypothetical protein